MFFHVNHICKTNFDHCCVFKRIFHSVTGNLDEKPDPDMSDEYWIKNECFNVQTIIMYCMQFMDYNLLYEMTWKINLSALLIIYSIESCLKAVRFRHAVTCFPYPSVCRTGVITSSKQEACPPTPVVLFPGTGPSHGDPFLWRHGQVTPPTAVRWENCEKESGEDNRAETFSLNFFSGSRC